MANSFKVNINLVAQTNHDYLKVIIMRILGPDSAAQARDLFKNSGTVHKELYKETSNHLVSLLPGAKAILSKDSHERKQLLFCISLISFGEKKIHVIKVVREVTGLGLRESKELIENLGIVEDGISHETAINTKAKLEVLGAKVTLESIGEPNQSEEFVVHGKKLKLANGEPVTPFEYEQLVSMLTPVFDSTALSILTNEEIEF